MSTVSNIDEISFPSSMETDFKPEKQDISKFGIYSPINFSLTGDISYSHYSGYFRLLAKHDCKFINSLFLKA